MSEGLELVIAAALFGGLSVAVGYLWKRVDHVREKYVPREEFTKRNTETDSVLGELFKDLRHTRENYLTRDMYERMASGRDAQLTGLIGDIRTAALETKRTSEATLLRIETKIDNNEVVSGKRRHEMLQQIAQQNVLGQVQVKQLENIEFNLRSVTTRLDTSKAAAP